MSTSTYNIVVLGAGYGGISCTTRLSRKFRRNANVAIHLVDRYTYHLLETRLHERAVRKAEVTVPIARLLEKRPNVTFHLGEITRIDLNNKYVELDFGLWETAPTEPRQIKYDALVIAIGSKTNFYQIPGLEQYAFQLKQLEDSEKIREQTDAMFAMAQSERNPERRKEYLRFVIGGGGLTGVELATEMAERFNDLCAQYRIDENEPEMILIELGDRILPSLDGKQVRKSIEAMEAMGIKILTKTRVMGMSEEENGRRVVHLQPGESLPTRTMIWTGGIRISDLIRKTGAEVGAMGRVVVDEYLQVKGFPGVFAIGDNALAVNPKTQETVPAAAQFALQQGYLTADNLLRLAQNESLKPYRPRVLGEIISLGKHLAVGWAALPIINRFKFIGFLGSLIKRAVMEKHLILLWKERQNWSIHW